MSKVENKLAKLEPWLASRSTYFDTSDYGNSVASVEQKLNNYEAYAAQAQVGTRILVVVVVVVAAAAGGNQALLVKVT